MKLERTREKEYLGDGVYANVNVSGQLVLTAEDGTRSHDVVFLEDEVFAALLEYTGVATAVRRLKERIRKLEAQQQSCSDLSGRP